MRSDIFALAGLLCVAATTSTASPLESLLATRSLKCSFHIGQAADWKAGSPKMMTDSLKNPLHFDSISPDSGTARIIGKSSPILAESAARGQSPDSSRPGATPRAPAYRLEVGNANPM